MTCSRLTGRAAILVVAVGLAGCTTMAGSKDDPIAAPAKLEAPTQATDVLRSLPPPARKLDVAVYNFPDQTGQRKPNPGGNFADFSHAVTQGGADILVDVLREAGEGEWFDVIERRRLESLAQERDIIKRTREAAGERPALSPLRFAGILLQGGIVGYDTNETTGGIGVRLLGIGGNTEYRRDVVTVALRAVSVQTGRVLSSVTTTKTIYSTLLQGTTFKFVGVDEILEVDAGFTRNHPTNLAVREAIELAVYSLVQEGASNGLWQFADAKAAAPMQAQYERAKGTASSILEMSDVSQVAPSQSAEGAQESGDEEVE